MNESLRVRVIASILGVAAATVVACSSTSSSNGTPGETAPSGATPFTIPATGWNYGDTCTSATYAVYPTSTCDTTGYVLCENGRWADYLCSNGAPGGYTETADDGFSDAGDDDGGEAADAGYPACGDSCPACTELQSCCADVSLPNAGVCDHANWDESVCETLLNKYSAQCGEHCDGGKCENNASEDGGGADSGGGESDAGDESDGGGQK